MEGSTEDSLSSARSSWRSNIARSDKRSRQKQLHGLHKLLTVGRQKLVDLLEQNYSTPWMACELDLSITIQDIATHLQLLKANEEKPASTPWGLSRTELAPSGVVLIVAAPAATNTIKSFFGPITAAIAAGDVVVVGSRSHSHPLLHYLQRQSKAFLNPDLFYVLNEIEFHGTLLSLVDKLIIIDDETKPYEGLLESPKTTHYSPNEGLSVAIVGEGKKDWTDLVSQIRSATPPETAASESLQGIFVRKEEKDAFLSKFIPGNPSKSSMNGSVSGSMNGSIHHKKVSFLDAAYLDSITFEIELGSVLTAARSGDPNMGKYLSEAKEKQITLIVLYTSLEQVIDALRKVDQKMKSLVFMAPVSAKAGKYLNDFVPSRVFSVDKIPCALPTAIQGASTALTLYPTSLFSDMHVIVSPSKTSNYMGLTVDQIRVQYEKLIEPLTPDDKGERWGFFDQVFYTVIGAGSVLVLGILLAAYYGWRAYHK